jgi:D-arabinose 5-phosphate isomerase GutQ
MGRLSSSRNENLEKLLLDSVQVHSEHLYDASVRAWRENDVARSIELVGNLILDTNYAFTNAVGRSEYMGAKSMYLILHDGLGYNGKKGKFCTYALSPDADEINPEGFDLKSSDLVLSYSSSGSTSIPAQIVEVAHEADIDERKKSHGLRAFLACVTSNPHKESHRSIPGICRYRWFQITHDKNLVRDYFREDTPPIVYVPGGEERAGSRLPDYIERQLARRPQEASIQKSLPEMSQLFLNYTYGITLSESIKRGKRFSSAIFNETLDKLSEEIKVFPNEFQTNLPVFLDILIEVLNKKRTLVAGESQSEYFGKSLVTRMVQLGWNARMRNGLVRVVRFLDNPEVAFDKDDVLIAISGYGKGQRTVARHARRAKEAGSTVVLFTYDPQSTMATDFSGITYPIKNTNYPLLTGFNIRTGDIKTMIALDVFAYGLQKIVKEKSTRHSNFTKAPTA